MYVMLIGRYYSPSPNNNFPEYSIMDCWPSEILQGHGIFINNMYILFRRTINVTWIDEDLQFIQTCSGSTIQTISWPLFIFRGGRLYSVQLNCIYFQFPLLEKSLQSLVWWSILFRDCISVEVCLTLCILSVFNDLFVRGRKFKLRQNSFFRQYLQMWKIKVKYRTRTRKFYVVMPIWLWVCFVDVQLTGHNYILTKLKLSDKIHF